MFDDIIKSDNPDSFSVGESVTSFRSIKVLNVLVTYLGSLTVLITARMGSFSQNFVDSFHWSQCTHFS